MVALDATMLVPAIQTATKLDISFQLGGIEPVMFVLPITDKLIISCSWEKLLGNVPLSFWPDRVKVSNPESRSESPHCSGIGPLLMIHSKYKAREQ